MDASSDSKNRKTGEALHQPELSLWTQHLISQFLHWIRNPLSSIGLHTELIEEELNERNISTAEITGLLDSIQTDIDRLNLIAGEFYQFVRTPELELEVMDMNELCSDLAGLHGEQFRSRNCLIRTAFSSESLPAQVDPDQLNIALLNLLDNAADSMDSGGEIVLATSRRNDRIEISVADGGAGIPEGERDNIFQPFYTTKKTGTGLGLACCHKIARIHNGSVQFENSPGGGKVFTLVLPLHGQVG